MKVRTVGDTGAAPVSMSLTRTEADGATRWEVAALAERLNAGPGVVKVKVILLFRRLWP